MAALDDKELRDDTGKAAVDFMSTRPSPERL